MDDLATVALSELTIKMADSNTPTPDMSFCRFGAGALQDVVCGRRHERIDARAPRERGGNLAAPVNLELRPQHVAVHADGAGGDAEAIGDLACRATGREQGDDLELANGEAGGRSCCLRHSAIMRGTADAALTAR